MLGSLTFYRRILRENFFSTPSIRNNPPTLSSKIVNANQQLDGKLPTIGHGLAGILAGVTVSFVAAPVEHVKARLQVQYAADKSKRLYSGPVDVVRKIVCGPHASMQKSIPMLNECNRFEPTGSGAYTTGCPPPFSSAPSSSSGGAPTTFSPATSPTTPPSPRPPSISGPAVSRPKSSGSPHTHPMSSSSAS